MKPGLHFSRSLSFILPTKNLIFGNASVLGAPQTLARPTHGVTRSSSSAAFPTLRRCARRTTAAERGSHSPSAAEALSEFISSKDAAAIPSCQSAYGDDSDIREAPTVRPASSRLPYLALVASVSPVYQGRPNRTFRPGAECPRPLQMLPGNASSMWLSNGHARPHELHFPKDIDSPSVVCENDLVHSRKENIGSF